MMSKEKIDLTTVGEACYVMPNFKGSPAENSPHGVLTALKMELPEFQSISHYTSFQRHDPPRQQRTDQAIGGGNNRTQGLRIDRWEEAIEGGLFAILRLENGDWMSLLPIAGPQTLAWLAPGGDTGVQVKVGTLGTAPVQGSLPVIAWCRGNDVYNVCRRVWKIALSHPLMHGMGRLREEKSYPEIFNYLGWCSWELYKRDINSDRLVGNARKINESELPVRFFLVDDGYFCHDDRGDMMENRLVQLGPNPETFPEGWAPLLDMRRGDGIRWFGLWQNFNGYWDGIARDNRLGDEINKHLMDVPESGRLPRPELQHAVAWYEEMVNMPDEAGFDFVKVDHQAQNLFKYRGTGNAAETARNCSRALERAVAARMDGLINCMAHGPINSFNTCLSSVTRCSEDYKVNNEWRAKAHLHNSYQNMLWLGPTVWGDHDMFHSSDEFAGRMMAVSKAISGGPVYLSDHPDDFNADVVMPLCDSDGSLFRPLAPAVPLPGSVMVDPFEHEEPYVVAAPLPNGAAAIVIYNLTEPTRPVEMRIGLEDYRNAAGLLPEIGDWPEPEEGLVVFDFYTGEIGKPEDGWKCRLEDFEDRLLLLCPIHAGWAVIGRRDKYLAPAAVEVLHVCEEEVVLKTPEPCEITLWREGNVFDVKLQGGKSRINQKNF